MPGVTHSSNNRSAPRWMADYTGREHLEPWPAKVDAYQFKDANGVLVKLSAAASINDVSISVDALSGPIPKNALLHFGESKEMARVTTAAVKGATSIAVEALPAALEDNDEAVYSTANRITIKSGTLLGRTYTERDAGTGFGPAADGDDEIFLLAFDIPNAIEWNDCELYRHHSRVKENYLPDWSTLGVAGAEVQTVTITGTLSAGGFTFYNPRNGETSTLVAYNGNLAAIQAALDEIYGASNSVAAGTIASFTITFAADLDDIDMPPIEVQPDGVTGLTGINVTQTTRGGYWWRDTIRSLYQTLKGTN